VTALSANRSVIHLPDQELREYLVGAAEHIYRNGFVGIDPAGYAKAFVPGDRYVGIAYGEVDNSAGAAAAKRVTVYIAGDFSLYYSGAAVKDAGKPVFATDDGTIALTGHPDAYVGTILHRDPDSTSYFIVRHKLPGEKPPNGIGSIELTLTGHETFTETGATAGTFNLEGFDGKSALGLGILMEDAENAGITFQFDATAEIALASVRTTDDRLPVDKGITFEAELVVSDSGDSNTLDIDFGLGTALTTNSEADCDHADMAQLACFHLDGASDNILAQSDNATTDVAAVDTTVDNDSTTDVAKKFKIVVRPDGTVEYWIAGARVLSTTSFAVLATAVLAAFINMEKTSNDTTAVLTFRNLRVAGGCAA
jgi:hypothetical protein